MNYKEDESYMLNTILTLEEIKKRIAPIAESYGVAKIYLFGSSIWKKNLIAILICSLGKLRIKIFMIL